MVAEVLVTLIVDDKISGAFWKSAYDTENTLAPLLEHVDVPQGDTTLDEVEVQ